MKTPGCQNKFEKREVMRNVEGQRKKKGDDTQPAKEVRTVQLPILVESLAPDTDTVSPQKFKHAKRLRAKQLAKLFKTTLVRVLAAIKEAKLPHWYVQTGTRGRPPIEVDREVALKIREAIHGKAAVAAPVVVPATETPSTPAE